jgi:hypothetical protein
VAQTAQAQAGPAASPAPWSDPPSLDSYVDNRARSSTVTVPVVAAGGGGRSRATQDQASQRPNVPSDSFLCSRQY